MYSVHNMNKYYPSIKQTKNSTKRQKWETDCTNKCSWINPFEITMDEIYPTPLKEISTNTPYRMEKKEEKKEDSLFSDDIYKIIQKYI